MIHLDKQHNPRRNAGLLEDLLKDPQSLEETTCETQSFFNEIQAGPAAGSAVPKTKWTEKLWSLLAIKHSMDDEHRYTTEVSENEVYPSWRNQLDEEYHKLEQTVERHVTVTDFGAVGDGLTDCTAAFEKAIGKGKVDVYVPAGVYLVRKIELPSWTRLRGDGKGETVLKLSAAAPKRRRLVTNKNHLQGNRNIAVERLTLDWHVERLGAAEKTGSGGTASSCLTFAHVTYGWVKEVEAVNPGLHCFDITSPQYNYAGDGTRARGGSRYVWLDGVSGYGFGDDGATTHHSDYIFISNSHFSDPSGRAHKKGYSNSNGIEIDDGSRYVWLLNNSSARCFGGVEIKAHDNSSAATGVYISGHISVNDNRSFNFRHIGHHREGDPDSKTAYNIMAQRLVSIHPVDIDLYRDSDPRALVVSAYRNVTVNRFLFVGDPEYDYRGNPAAAVQFRAAHVSLSNGEVSGFLSAGSDLLIAGGTRHVRVRNIHSSASAKEAVKVDEGSQNALVEGVRQEDAGLE